MSLFLISSKQFGAGKDNYEDYQRYMDRQFIIDCLAWERSFHRVSRPNEDVPDLERY
jgi:hypothetical protein